MKNSCSARNSFQILTITKGHFLLFSKKVSLYKIYLIELKLIFEAHKTSLNISKNVWFLFGFLTQDLTKLDFKPFICLTTSSSGNRTDLFTTLHMSVYAYFSMFLLCSQFIILHKSLYVVANRSHIGRTVAT